MKAFVLLAVLAFVPGCSPNSQPDASNGSVQAANIPSAAIEPGTGFRVPRTNRNCRDGRPVAVFAVNPVVYARRVFTL